MYLRDQMYIKDQVNGGMDGEKPVYQQNGKDS